MIQTVITSLLALSRIRPGIVFGILTFDRFLCVLTRTVITSRLLDTISGSLSENDLNDLKVQDQTLSEYQEREQDIDKILPTLTTSDIRKEVDAFEGKET